jgi:alpha-aminoadipic semialdehyde synthase
MSIPPDRASFISALSDAIPSSDQVERTLEALDWLTKTGPHASATGLDLDAPQKPILPIDLFSTLLAHRLQYEPHERDIVILSHEFVVRSSASPDSLREMAREEAEVHTSTLVAYGTPGSSAMSRCVGLPIAFAALMVIDGHVRARGVAGPGVEEGVYRGVLRGLEERGLGMVENVRKGEGMSDLLYEGLTGSMSHRK